MKSRKKARERWIDGGRLTRTLSTSVALASGHFKKKKKKKKKKKMMNEDGGENYKNYPVMGRKKAREKPVIGRR